MQQESRVKKSLLNARVNLIFYFITLALSFFSRKIFLDCLGPDFVGLSGTLANILGFLSLAEMGVGAAVAYNLYKPLQRGDKLQIEELVSVFGYLYRKIGIFVALSGVVISVFIPLIFKESGFNLLLIYFAFYAILSSALFSYFINYRQIILSADQRGYVVTAYLQSGAILKAMFQMAVAVYWGNYYVWIALEIVFGLFVCIVLNWKIAQTYPWLNANIKKGKKAFPRHKKIIAFTKQIFVHKIKDFLLFQSDQILVFVFVSLKMVAYYGNYTLITTKLTHLFSTFLGSFWASVGNLVAEGDKEKTISVFWEIQSLYFIFSSITVYGIYHFLTPLITLWLGTEYILDHSILILLSIYAFLGQVRGAVDMYNGAHGQVADTWAAATEGAINISVTLLTAPRWGIQGILFGKIISVILMVIIWKPYYLFHGALKQSVLVYWKEFARHMIVLCVAFGCGNLIYQKLPIDATGGLVEWLLATIISTILFSCILIPGLYIFCKGPKILTTRLLTHALHH